MIDLIDLLYIVLILLVFSKIADVIASCEPFSNWMGEDKRSDATRIGVGQKACSQASINTTINDYIWSRSKGAR
jgi:hypothetical protein